MNREQAIFYIKELQKTYASMDKKVAEAIDIAMEALSEDISEDGTLKVNVSDASKVKRVMVWGEESGGLYYPDRPKGEWIEVTNGRGGHECSNCYAYAPSYMSGDEHLSDFCPNCGADMRGGKE